MASAVKSAVNLAIFGTICSASLSIYAFKKLRGSKKAKEQLEIENADKRLKVVVISGCDTGFGRLIAEAWSRQPGMVVVALTLTEKSAQELDAFHEERKDGDSACNKIVAIQCDVTSNEDVQAAKQRIKDLLAERDAVLYSIVNNAGIIDPGDFVFYNDLSSPRRVMEVNYFGQLAVTQALLPLMLTTSKVAGGKIFNMGSVCGTSVSAGNSSYCATKFAIEAWSDTLRLELEPFNVEVVTIRPGQCNTGIQNECNDRWMKNFRSSSAQVQNLYGRSAYEKKFKEVIDASVGDGSSLTPPTLVVDTMTEALLSKHKLQPHYWVGDDAHTFWKAMHLLPKSVMHVVKTMLKIAPQETNLPPPKTVAHVTIRVSDMERSLKFYTAMGFEPIGPREGGLQFLQFNPSNNGTWESLILLKEDKDMPRRGKCTDAGMTRLSFLRYNIERDCEVLKARHGIEPIGPLTVDKTDGSGTKLYVFQDPDGFILYWAEIPSFILNLILWWSKKKVPAAFHWTINVSDYKHANSFFENFGFKTMSDQNKDQVLNDLLAAFNIDPVSTVIEWIRLCYLPKGGIVATIMEWVTPKSVVNKASVSNSMTLSVVDVKAELEKAKLAGLIVDGAPTYETLPIYGNVLVGKAYLEKENCPIEFCCFSNQEP